jgi:SAM-dependent methyltransferase
MNPRRSKSPSTVRPAPGSESRTAVPGNEPTITQRFQQHAVLERASLRAWDRVLVLESGDCWLAEEVWRRLQRGYVCGLELSDELVTRAVTTRGIAGQLEYRAWDSTRIPFEGGFFDLVLGNSVIEHCPTPRELMGEIRRVLKTSGALLLLEPNGTPDPGPGMSASSRHQLRTSDNECGRTCITELATDAGLEPRQREDLRIPISNRRLIGYTLFSLVPLPQDRS